VAVDHILTFCSFLTWRQRHNAARKRDLSRVKRAVELAQKLALVVNDIEADKSEDVLNAVELFTNRLNSMYAEASRERKQRGKHFPERDFCINLLISYVWNKAKAKSILEPEKIGDKNGPLAKFLAEAYEPIESLTPSTVLEIAPLPRRRPDRYSRDSWNWGKMDLRRHRELFDQQGQELDELSEQQAREIEEMKAGQTREIDELCERQAREIEGLGSTIPAHEVDEALKQLAREADEMRVQQLQEIDRLRRGLAPS
jgi:hypothetical protein